MIYTSKLMAQLLLTGVRSNLHKKNIILLSEASIVIYKAGRHTGVENKFIYFNIPTGTHSIDPFNAKITELIQRQRKDWEQPQIKDFRFAIPQGYEFMASNNILVNKINDLRKLH